MHRPCSVVVITADSDNGILPLTPVRVRAGPQTKFYHFFWDLLRHFLCLASFYNPGSVMMLLLGTSSDLISIFPLRLKHFCLSLLSGISSC